MAVCASSVRSLAVCSPARGERRRQSAESGGTQFTCFTSTKVQTLTPEELRATADLSLGFKKSQLNTDARPLLRAIMSAFFDGHSGFVDMCVKHLPSPLAATATKVDATLRNAADMLD